MRVVVRKVMLASATLFQKKHRSLSKAPMLSGLLGLLKLPLDSLFPLFTQYRETVEQRSILVIWAHLDELALPVFVGLLEDREDRPPSNPVQAYPQAISWVLGFKKKEEDVH